MRFLILSCNTGEGHNSAAKAIKDSLADIGISSEIMDSLSFWSPATSKLISKGHVFLYRNLPKLFGIGYRFEENHHPKDDKESLMYELVVKGCKALYEHLCQNNYDAVVSTHVFSGMVMTEIKRKYDFNIKTYFVATDYTCAPGVNQIVMDAFFIPHKNLLPEFIQNKIPADRLVPSGIPVRRDFYNKITKDEAKEKLSLPKDSKIVLLMCGSMGCGPIKSLAQVLPEKLPKKTMLIIICGNNKRLYNSLTKNPLPQNLQVIGFTKEFPTYLEAAELILTKPGGLSSTESCVKATPMVFIDAVPGCETRNIEFFTENDFAVSEKTVTGICDIVCDYLENPDKLEKMSAVLKAEFSGCAAQTIREYIIKDVSSENDKLLKT